MYFLNVKTFKGPENFRKALPCTYEQPPTRWNRLLVKQLKLNTNISNELQLQSEIKNHKKTRQKHSIYSFIDIYT